MAISFPAELVLTVCPDCSDRIRLQIDGRPVPDGRSYFCGRCQIDFANCEITDYPAAVDQFRTDGTITVFVDDSEWLTAVRAVHCQRVGYWRSTDRPTGRTSY